GFGTQPIDVEGDGLVDLVVLNGDIDDYSSTGRPWKMPITAFRNEGGLRFRDLSQSCGRDFTEPQLGRGLSRVDLNCDGAADLVAVRHDGNVRLLLNQTPQQPGNVVFRLVGRGRGRELLG
ncbi:MAG: FG-GAP-like repeat-containing protein, partial [Planctomycetaceae bacterium]